MKIGLSLIFALIVLVLLLTLISVGYDINKRVASIEKMKEVIRSRSDIVKNLSIMQSDLNQVQPYGSAINDLIINKDGLLNVLSDVSGLTSQLKVSAAPSFVGEESKTVGLGSVGLALNGNASFDTLIRFLGYLEKGKYFFQFDNLDLNQSGGSYKFTINGRVFYVNENK